MTTQQEESNLNAGTPLQENLKTLAAMTMMQMLTKPGEKESMN